MVVDHIEGDIWKGSIASGGSGVCLHLVMVVSGGNKQGESEPDHQIIQKKMRFNWWSVIAY